MRLEHSFTESFPELAQEATPNIPHGSYVAWVNEPLAQELGLDPAWLATEHGLRWLTGTHEPESEKDPATFALAYSGFQFGNLSPVLGDGRAHLTGELVVEGVSGDAARRVDLHLKGSGITPFSRPGADGKAPLSAVWREAVIGEFFAALNVPTSRAFAVINTGEKIYRRAPQPEPAGILVRVAASHVRVGTFQFAQMNLSEQQRADLVEYALQRHYGSEIEASEPAALTLLRSVAQRQADLVAQWMGLGFVHGVLNTDNVAVSGESIDFGPCAFMDQFRFNAVFSSIDRQGRYAFGNQPAITQWNLARFAETLLDLIDEDPNKAVELGSGVLTGFEERFQRRWLEVFAAKLGVKLGDGESENKRSVLSGFVGRTLNMLERDSLDFTTFFWTLAHEPQQLIQENDADRASVLRSWLKELESLRATFETTEQESQQLMETANPRYIPRNFALDAALRAVEKGDQSEVERLIDVLRNPFLTRQDGADLERVPENPQNFVSFCGT
ncbi:MAG: protein adenylyltransferase SelO family protein [Rothia sp. (in: high G+C Gram-positive bacteria)]|nr:protein adenylyltransferase SelO family protein [Rothia sp. (in: high G+C Gram-positive bacteria)]